MRRGILTAVWIGLMLAAGAISCGGGDDSGGSADDATDDVVDDTSGDDTTDESSDDTGGDDAADDSTDDTADDTSDDDADIYADLSPAGAPLSELFGISSHMAGGSGNWARDFEVEKLLELGALRVRRDFPWSGIEPQNDVWNWSETDGLYALAQDPGLDFIALLDYGVDWAMPGGSHSEIKPSDWADFAGHVAERYCDAIKTYEIWNEENLSGRFWLPRNDPDHYGELLIAGAAAVRAACPDATVVFGGMSTFDLPDMLFYGPYHFFDRVLEAHPEACDAFDVMAIHPYSFAQTLTPEMPVELLTFNYPDVPGQVDDIRERMASAGCSGKPVWWTEYGWPSLIIGDDYQASFLARSILLGAMKGVEGMYWYTFWDGHGGVPATENTFGLFTAPDTEDPPPAAKPSYAAYKTLADILGGTRYAGDLSAKLGLPEDVYALAFMEGAARIVVAAWDGAGVYQTHEVSLPWPAGATSASVTHLDGAADAGPWSDPVELVLSPDVRYVEFERGKR